MYPNQQQAPYFPPPPGQASPAASSLPPPHGATPATTAPYAYGGPPANAMPSHVTAPPGAYGSVNMGVPIPQPQVQAQPQVSQSPAALVAAATQRWGPPPVRKNLPPPAQAPQQTVNRIPAHLASRPTSLRNIMSNLKNEARSMATSLAAQRVPQYRPDPVTSQQPQQFHQAHQPMLQAQPGMDPNVYHQPVQTIHAPTPRHTQSWSSAGYATHAATATPQGSIHQPSAAGGVQYAATPTGTGQGQVYGYPPPARISQHGHPTGYSDPSTLTHRYSVAADAPNTYQTVTPPGQLQQPNAVPQHVISTQGQHTFVNPNGGNPGHEFVQTPEINQHQQRYSTASVPPPQPAGLEYSPASQGYPGASPQTASPPIQPQHGQFGASQITYIPRSSAYETTASYQHYAVHSTTPVLQGGQTTHHTHVAHPSYTPAPTAIYHPGTAATPIYADAAATHGQMTSQSTPATSYGYPSGQTPPQMPQNVPAQAVSSHPHVYPSPSPAPVQQQSMISDPRLRKPVGTPQSQTNPAVSTPSTPTTGNGAPVGHAEPLVAAPPASATHPSPSTTHHEHNVAQNAGHQIIQHHQVQNPGSEAHSVPVAPTVSPSTMPEVQDQTQAVYAHLQREEPKSEQIPQYQPQPQLSYTQESMHLTPQPSQPQEAFGSQATAGPALPQQGSQAQHYSPGNVEPLPLGTRAATLPSSAAGYYEQHVGGSVQALQIPPPPPIPLKTPEVPGPGYVGEHTIEQRQSFHVTGHQIDNMVDGFNRLAVGENFPAAVNGPPAGTYVPAPAPVSAPAPHTTRDMTWLDHDWCRPPLTIKDSGEPNKVIWDCPGSIRDITYEATWYTLPDVPDFLVCTRCHDRYLRNTQLLSTAFVKTQRSNGRCRFNVPRITQVLLPQCVQVGSLDMLKNYMQKRLNIKDCKAQLGATDADGLSWFVITPDTNDVMINFVACEACYEDLIVSNSPYAGEFMPRVDRYPNPQPKDSNWFCDLHFPYIRRAFFIYSRNNAPFADWVAKATEWFRLPNCDGKVVESASRSWVRPRDPVDKMVICQKCYLDAFGWTVLQDDFEDIPIPKSRTGSEWMDEALGYRTAPATAWTCDAQSIPMKQAIEAAVKRQNGSLFTHCARKIMTSPPCTDKGMPGGTWYTLKADGCEDFIVCQACFVGSCEAFDSAQFFKNSSLTGNPAAYLCNRNPSSARFRQFEMSMYKAQQEGVWSSFSDEVREYIDLPVCAREEHVNGRKWYGWHDCLICPECYKSVCKDTKGSLVFEVENELIEDGRMCCLYSPRMREKWATACARGDATELLEFSRVRHAVYARTVPQMRMLREMQQMQMMTAMSAGMAGLMYQGASAIQSVSGATDGYLHGNSSLGWYDTENGATGAQKFNEMRSGMNAANGAGTWGQIFMLAAEWDTVQ